MRRELSDAELSEYLRRAYHAVDGLWFLKVEEALGFDQALELDRRVWEVLAKIQARKARETVGATGNSPEDLCRCFSLKLQGDGHSFEAHVDEQGVRFVIHECPWLKLLRKSDRGHVASRVAQTICPTEGRVWCQEFGGEYHFEMPRMACVAGEGCEMRFAKSQARGAIPSLR